MNCIKQLQQINQCVYSCIIKPLGLFLETPEHQRPRHDFGGHSSLAMGMQVLKTCNMWRSGISTGALEVKLTIFAGNLPG